MRIIMEASFKRILASLVAAGFLAGCSGGDEGDSAAKALPADPLHHADEVGQKLHAAFNGDSGSSAAVDEVAKALKANDYEGAAMGVMVMQRTAPQNRSFAQSQVLNQLMVSLQASIAERAAAGDPAAMKAAEALRASASGGQ